jgi:hypothetical protein
MLWHALINSAVHRLLPYRIVMSEHFSKPHICSGSGRPTRFHFVHQPNWAFNVDANMGHAFGIVMAHIGTLRTTCSGAS